MRRSSPQRFFKRSSAKGHDSKGHDNKGFDASPSTFLLYGWHPVVEALKNPLRRFHRLLLTENSARKLDEEGIALTLSPEIVSPNDINRLVGDDAVHQGLYAEVDPLPALELEDLGPDALVLAFDQITDPHNVGAIVRSAAAFKVDAIITTQRHSPAATGVLAKSASGGLEHVPFIVVGNLGNALLDLAKRGFLRLGLDSDGDGSLQECTLHRPLVLCLGAEGKGLRHRTRECCDKIVQLDMPGAIKSINVSNAAAIALYAVTTRL